MFRFLKAYKREFFYTTILFVIWEMALLPEIIGLDWAFFVYAVLGAVLVLSWTVTTYFRYADHEISRFTKVLMKIQLKERFFLYFIMPMLFYSLITIYLFVNKSMVLNQLVIITGSILYFVMFIHIRSSYAKVFSISKYTRVIFNFIDITIFYLIVALLVMSGTEYDIRILGTVVAAAMLLMHQLTLHKQRTTSSLIILGLSLVLISSAAIYFINTNFLIYPLIMTLVFYVIVTWWNIRLDGYTKASEYLPPLIFALMGFIIVLSF